MDRSLRTNYILEIHNSGFLYILYMINCCYSYPLIAYNSCIRLSSHIRDTKT